MLLMVIMNTQPVEMEADWDSLKHSVIMKIEAFRQRASIVTTEQLGNVLSGNVPALPPFRLILTMPDTPFPNPDMRRQTAHRKLLEQQYLSTVGNCTSCGKL